MALFAGFYLDRERWETAFEKLYEAHGELVYNFVRSILRDKDDADDCTVETFELAYRAMKKGHVVDESRAWLLTIARHRAIRIAQSRRWFGRLEDAPEAFAPFDFSRQVHNRAVVEQLFAGLGKDEQEAFWMHDGLGLTHQEIADVLEQPIGTVLSRIFRARKKVQRGLNPAEVGA